MKSLRFDNINETLGFDKDGLESGDSLVRDGDNISGIPQPQPPSELEDIHRWDAPGKVYAVPGQFGSLTGVVPISGNLFATGLQTSLKAGTPYASIRFRSSSTASVGLTHSWACLFDMDTNTVLRSSNDDVTEWSGDTIRTFNLIPFTPVSDIVHPAIGLVVTVSTTLPTIFGTSNSNAFMFPPYVAFRSTPTYTTPLADNTVITGSAWSGRLMGTVS